MEVKTQVVRHRSQAKLVTIAAFAFIATIIAGIAVKKSARHEIKVRQLTQTGASLHAQGITAIQPIEPVSRQSAQFYEITKGLEDTNECLPVLVDSLAKYDLEYLYCSNKAYQTDGESRTVTSNFTVPDSLARRVNFWRRIYSHFSSKQEVMHLAEYPEVVLEIYDFSNKGELSYHQQRKAVAAIAKTQKQLYRRIFMELQRFRNADPATYTPEMRRVAALMAHIKDTNKYLVAAASIRTQTGQRDYVANGLRQGARYLNEIEDEFDKQGLPRELARLSFVESSFNLNARSKVGASGVFQIMHDTGKQYLKIEDGIDERNDPIKASRAAAKLLRMNYGLTGAWPLAITAYNHGVGSMLRAARVTGSSDIETILNRYKDRNFGFASKNFYTEYLAMLLTLQDAQRLFPEVGTIAAIRYDTVRLPREMPIETIRKSYKVSSSQLVDLNPDIFPQHIRRNGALPRGFQLKIPVAKPQVSAIYSKSPTRT
jgi:membrane-bound lytic murein transglycosylase D